MQARNTPTLPTPIAGRCDPRFARVRQAFVENFVDHGEVGAALSVFVDGVLVVDLCGGHTDETRTAPWCPDTLVNVYSVGKGVLAVLTLILVERGLIDLDAPVATFWPEFAVGGKSALTVRALLAHRAGLPALRKRLPEGAMFDWAVMTGALAGEVPFWVPGSAHGYHVNTYGYLVGELIRRVTGMRVGEAVRTYVTGPLDADFSFGLPPAEHGRAASICGAAADVVLRGPAEWAMAFPPTGDEAYDQMMWHAYFNPSGLSGTGVVNTAAWREAEIPSSNGHGTARAVAAVYAAFLAGGPPSTRWVGPMLRREATMIHSDGEDRVLRRPSRFGLGFQLPQPTRPIGPNPGAFGHFGYGGSLGCADPEAAVAFAYLMNRPGERWETARLQRLVDALYSCLR
jgi:CubicO group peptidase (beta-lactamase class C family)